ncbi:MAG: ABC transporter ATP-binding protein [Planctomycetes bacterium]|nr:ABC transporter ATP-binding protein [Planctomycetota bacterium]
MISVSELTKRYGAFLAVDRVSFEIARGEVVGFLGPNGAGKTTTIRVLTGFHPASSGRAVVAGFDVATDSLQARQNLGYLPQEVPIYPDLRVVEYLHYRAKLKGVANKDRKLAVSRAMDKAGIADVGRKLCGQVSHGYRQRVGLADALVANPPILILDEPTSGLDPNQRVRIKQVVRDLANEHTILFSSHILAEVQEVTSRVLIIHRGTLRADGAPDQLVARAVDSTLRLRVAAPPERLGPVLAGLPGLSGQAQLVAVDGGCELHAPVAAGADPRDELGRRLLAAGLAVRELWLERPTLEAYFQSITDGDAPVAVDAQPVLQEGAR